MSFTACKAVRGQKRARLKMLWDLQAIKKEVDTAVEEAKTGPLPKDELLWKNIYMDGLGMLLYCRQEPDGTICKHAWSGHANMHRLDQSDLRSAHAYCFCIHVHMHPAS